ncbi:cysteine-rich small domain protein [Clostridium argentinense CDC 2741]|uniref:Cysteine-rich small domain protein n=1 Tax=Clostridium argentinense CDC 2741 TaxID=1418104 RepID=A0A0C1U0R5_9CLOT|nr:cysteine-rich small domain-containing protein [Clostridium argentinense]ARC86957.1 metal-binding protein [Clostridium argentinense]KIE45103.1 cysteine-rich small domain protein [Clostridium argentinense CDC 2741]NFF39436.1 metal-binding protein [Clostridium argentinense]NFP50359.1 metal-binding protein [Clostridium argentinense]NFP74221.1 metal-binding protein [Clostridium argentinense]
MSENYKFFQHKECEFFPCHKVKDEDKFNCLFCYCPLYFLEECGGNNSDFNGVKDCSNCMIPHSQNGYDYIFNKIVEKNREKTEKSKEDSADC